MPDGLKIVPSRLLVPDMGVDTCVSGGTSQVLAISERNVLTIRGLVALGETKVDDVNCALGLVSAANQKVIWLDVSVDDSLLVDHLDPLDHLHGDVENSADVELSSALLEEVLEGFTEHVHDHDVVHLAVLCFFIAHKV